MNHLLIYCHPNPGSFNHAIKEVIVQEAKAAGHTTSVRDVYAL